MKTRNFLLIAVVTATLTIASGRSADAAPNGFLLTDTDAAYADWGPDFQDGCTGVSLFVGFVDAGRLQQPLGSRPITDHSDVQAILSFNCAGTQYDLEGVEQATNCPTATIDSLMSASVICVVIFDGGEGTVTIDLSWTAEGDIFTTTNHSPGNHSAHRTRTADVTGIVTIAVVSGHNFVFTGVNALDDARITHFNEIQIARP